MHELPDQPYRPWPDPNGPWQIRLDYDVIRGRIECTGFHIVGLLPSQALTSDVLRRVPLARLAEEDAQVRLGQAQELMEDAERTGNRKKANRARYLSNNLPSAGRRGRKPDPDSHYKEIADLYLQAVGEGIRHPTKQVAALRHVEYRTAATWVYRARERGLLPPTTPGKITRPRGANE
jgi:hypothetical protein